MSILRGIADKLWAMGLKDLSHRVHDAARDRERLVRRSYGPPYTFERLCFDCAPNVDWNPMTRGDCQRCGKYAFLMAFEIKGERCT